MLWISSSNVKCSANEVSDYCVCLLLFFSFSSALTLPKYGLPVIDKLECILSTNGFGNFGEHFNREISQPKKRFIAR